MRKRVLLAVAMGIIALAVPIAAQAAITPVARLSLASSHVTQGGTTRFTYSTSGLPAGSVVDLQGRVNGGAWKLMSARLGRSGQIVEAGTPVGNFQFRLLVTDARRHVTVSPVVNLIVQRASGGNPGRPSPWWGVLDSAAQGAADGAAGAVAGGIVAFLCFLFCWE
jgi:hypothetical protein